MKPASQFEHLITEERNPRTKDLDLLNTVDLVTRVQAEDSQVIQAVQKTIPQIAAAVDLIVERLHKGGRLIYFGAGTSGRLGILDASECPPTFGINYDLVTAYIAGGKNAVFEAAEGAEDRSDLGEQDVLTAKITANDIACGITASGRTPYVIGALRKAKELGASRIGVINNAVSNAKELVSLCNVTIAAVTGPEALTGSTRMKAGSAQKMVLNLLTTCTMVKLGKVYENLMVDVTPTNDKLKERAVSIITAVCSVPDDTARTALETSGNRAKTAILMIKKRISHLQAEELLVQCGGSLRKALTKEQV